MVPPSVVSSATQVKSEQDCFERLALEFASLPDREMPPEVSDPVAAQQQQQQLTNAACKSNQSLKKHTTPIYLLGMQGT